MFIVSEICYTLDSNMNVLSASDDSITSGIKVRLQCGQPELAYEWLQNLTHLSVLDESKKGMSDRALLEAILHQKDDVVLKIAADKGIEKELYISKRLEEAHIPNILYYYCYFECKDKIHRYLDRNLSSEVKLCKPNDVADTTIGVLVMEYVKNKNMKSFEWKAAIHEHELRNCIKHVIATIWMAWSRTKFIHKDLNLQNILLRKRPQNKTHIEYDNIGAIPLGTYEIVLMDFEHSEFATKDNERSLDLLQKDIRYFLSKIEFDLCVNVDGIQAVQNEVAKAHANKFVNILGVLNAVDQFTLTNKESRPNRTYTYNPNVFYGGNPKW